MAAADKKHPADLEQRTATENALLNSIRELWRQLNPDDTSFKEEVVEELSHYFHITQFEISTLCHPSKQLNQPTKVRLNSQLTLCTKIVEMLLNRFRK